MLFILQIKKKEKKLQKKECGEKYILLKKKKTKDLKNLLKKWKILEEKTGIKENNLIFNKINMEEKIIKLWFNERDFNCYVITWDIGNLDFQYSNNEDNIWIIMMWAMTEKVKDIKHLKDIVKARNKLWLTICY